MKSKTSAIDLMHKRRQRLKSIKALTMEIERYINAEQPIGGRCYQISDQRLVSMVEEFDMPLPTLTRQLKAICLSNGWGYDETNRILYPNPRNDRKVDPTFLTGRFEDINIVMACNIIDMSILNEDRSMVISGKQKNKPKSVFVYANDDPCKDPYKNGFCRISKTYENTIREWYTSLGFSVMDWIGWDGNHNGFIIQWDDSISDDTFPATVWLVPKNRKISYGTPKETVQLY